VAVWSALITIVDNKRKSRVMRVHFDAPAIPAEEREDIFDYMSEYIVRLDAIITGRIVNVFIGRRFDLSGLSLKAVPLAVSDVEEGALLNWGTSFGNVLQRIPTFDETLIVDGTDSVDLSDPAWVDFYEISILAIDLTGDWLVTLADNRGVVANRLLSAKESFKRG
jgi:hypothetical protein